jgi:hypothetical protein
MEVMELEQTTAFQESQVRPPGTEPIIAPDLQKLPMASPWDLVHHPRNVRRHNLAAIEHGLRLYGQQTPIVVQRSTGYVCKGNGTLKVARDVLNWNRMAISVEDFTDEMALRYLLDDNRASDLSDYDRPALGALLKSLDDGGTLQDTLWDLDSAETIWAEIGALTVVHAPTEADFAESPEEFAARLEARRSDRADSLKEVVLVMEADQYEAFALTVSRLSRAYGTKGVIATVLEAVKRAAEQVVA